MLCCNKHWKNTNLRNYLCNFYCREKDFIDLNTLFDYKVICGMLSANTPQHCSLITKGTTERQENKTPVDYRFEKNK